MTARLTSLSNGVRVATDTMRDVESVSVGIWIDCGTRYEAPEVNGVAHLLEHMAFKGTETRSARAIAEEVEAVGGQINAYTGREHTAYYCKILREDANLALDILADMVQHAVIDPVELSREQAVVIQEIGQAQDTPDDIIFDHFQATAFPAQALGRPVLGTVESVHGLDRSCVLGYMRGHYTGPRIVVSAAGRIDHEALVDMVGNTLGGMPNGKEPGLDSARYVGGEYREDRDLEQVHLVLGFEGVGYRHEDFYVQTVLSTLIGGGMSSRLFQEIRENRGLVYSIYSFASAYRDAGLFGVYAGTGDEQVGETVDVLCGELTDAARNLSDAEVERAKAQLRAGVLMARESTGSRCEQLAQQILVYGRPMTAAEVVEKVEAVDGTSVRRLLRKILSSKPTIAASGPLGHLEPLDAIAARLS